jgi:hypothetical protein
MRIPRSKIQQGIEFCKGNILNFLESAEILNKADRTIHASILVDFALEEYGKTMVLEDVLKQHHDPVIIDRGEFINHTKKEQKVWTRLDPKYRKIKVGGFEKDFESFHGYGFGSEIVTSHITCIECAFVDFDESQSLWHVGLPVKTRDLQNLIEYLKEETKKIM